MKKIAELAGVSRATVSRVLSKPEKVHPKTRERIQSLMEQSGYTYHAGAAELIKRKTFFIGLVIPSVISLAFSNTVLAVQEAADELGMSVILGCSEFDEKKESKLLSQFMTRRVAGVIMCGNTVENEDQILRLQQIGIPCVIIWTTPDNPNLCQAGFDNRAASATAVKYLIDMGHKHIALITGPLGGGRRVSDRILGFTSTMEKHGLAVPEGYLRRAEPTIVNGEREAFGLLEMSPRPTAIFAASDMLAIGVLSAARKMSLNVPRDLSVIGFDDIEFATHTEPPLTSVAVPEKEMSRMAIHMIKQLINKEISPPRTFCLDTQLIVRKSCAPPGDNGLGALPV